MAPDIEHLAGTAAAEEEEDEVEECPIHSDPSYVRRWKLVRWILAPLTVVCSIVVGVLTAVAFDGETKSPPIEHRFDPVTWEYTSVGPEQQYSVQRYLDIHAAGAMMGSILGLVCATMSADAVLAELVCDIFFKRQLGCGTGMRVMLGMNAILYPGVTALLTSFSVLSCRWEATHLAADGSMVGFPDIKPGGHYCFQKDDVTGMAMVLSWLALLGYWMSLSLMWPPRNVGNAICREKQQMADMRARDAIIEADKAAATAARLRQHVASSVRPPATPTDGESAERPHPRVPSPTHSAPPSTTSNPEPNDPPPPYAKSERSNYAEGPHSPDALPSSPHSTVRGPSGRDGSEELTFSALARPRHIMDTWSTWQPRPVWIRTPLRERSLADLTSGVADARFESR